MRIEPTESILGVPLIRIRELFRRARLCVWDEELASRVLGPSPESARALLEELGRRGFVERQSSAGPGGTGWSNTLRGNALAMASAARPVKRATDERALDGLLDRVRRVNGDPYYLYRVQTVVVFGSFLGSSPTVGDVDVAVALCAKEPDRVRHWALCEQRQEALEAGGRAFRNIVEIVGAAEAEVHRFLKSRSRVLSLHPFEDEIWKSGPHHVVYPET